MSHKPAKHLVITVHGIRTFGGWQEELEDIVKKSNYSQNITFAHYKYGYFSVIAFIIPIFRWIVVKNFRRSLKIYVDESYDRVDLIGHSFGTHLIAWALKGIEDKIKYKFHTVILSGSVLKSSFPWNEMLGRKVKRVVNDCGSRDNVLVLSQFWVLFTGMAGRVGLAGLSDENFKNRYSTFGHGGYFTDENGRSNSTYMRQNWLPIILSDEGIKGFDKRGPLTAFDGILITLGNNAEPIKMAIYIAPFIALALWLYQQRNNAISAALIAHFRTEELVRASPSSRLLPLAVGAARLSHSIEANRLVEREFRQLARRQSVNKTSVDVPLRVASPTNTTSIAVLGSGSGLEIFNPTSNGASNLERVYSNNQQKIDNYNHDGGYISELRGNSIVLTEILNLNNSRAIDAYSDSNSLVNSISGQYVAQWDDHKNLWVYDTHDNSLINGGPLKIEDLCGEGHIHRLLVSDNGRNVFVMLSGDSVSSVCEITIQNRLAKIIAIRPDMREMAIQKNGKNLAIAVMGSIVYIDENGSHYQINRNQNFAESSLKFSQDGRHIAYVSSNSVFVWDTDTKRTLASFTSDLTIFDICFSNRGQSIIVVGQSNDGSSAIEAWDLMAAETYKQAYLWPRSDISLVAVRSDDSVILHDFSGRAIILQKNYTSDNKMLGLFASESKVVYDRVHDIIVILDETISRMIKAADFSEIPIPPSIKGLKVESVDNGSGIPAFISYKAKTNIFDVWSSSGKLVAKDVSFESKGERVAFFGGGLYMATMLRVTPENEQTLVITNTFSKSSYKIRIESPFWSVETTKDGNAIVGDGKYIYIYDINNQKLLKSHKISLLDSFRIDATGRYLYGCIDGHLSTFDVQAGRLMSQSELGTDCGISSLIEFNSNSVYIKNEKIQKFDLNNHNILDKSCEIMREQRINQMIEVGDRTIDVCYPHQFNKAVNLINRALLGFYEKFLHVVSSKFLGSPSR